MSNVLSDDEFTFGIVEVIDGNFQVQLATKIVGQRDTEVETESLTGAGPLRARPEIS